MILIPHINGKTFFVLGLGKTGIGAIASLVASGADVIAWDDNTTSREAVTALFPQVNMIEPDHLDCATIDFIFLSPGIPTMGEKANPIVKIASDHNIPITSDFDLLYKSRSTDVKFVGITGTNGKSTTTALLGHILKACGLNVEVGGNIGKSVLELAQLPSGGIYVLEASSYQLDLAQEIAFNVAIILNITPDHLDRHLTMENYINAKARIFNHQNATDVAIISKDDANIKCEAHHKCFISTRDKGAYVAVINKQLFDNLNKCEFDLSAQKYIPGKHNDENIAAAYAAAISLGCNAADVIAAIMTFQGLDHRLQLVGKFGDLLFVNDSKATNAESVEKALQSYDNVIWIAGGLAKVGGISSLKPLFKKVKEAFLIGAAMDDFANTLSDSGVPFIKCGTLENALMEIKMRHKSGVVLLSPACASWDQYKSFEARGEEFAHLAKTLFAS
jgi:UDP-N-acetylmuramoylalanine--D-glutamate ligase